MRVLGRLRDSKREHWRCCTGLARLLLLAEERMHASLLPGWLLSFQCPCRQGWAGQGKARLPHIPSMARGREGQTGKENAKLPLLA